MLSRASCLREDERDEFLAAVEDRLRTDTYDPATEIWTAEYRRLRFLAAQP